MHKMVWVGALLLVAGQVAAKEKMIPLSAQDADALRGKTVALTLHEPPSFMAMTAGKASFALFGAAAMASAGNELVRQNAVPDPAGLVRDQLGGALAQAFGAQLLPLDAAPTKAVKPTELAKLHGDADYVLDVRSGGWNYAYFATQWGRYWVGYSVQVTLVETGSKRVVSNVACAANTINDGDPPTREALHANQARLLKHVTAALGARCVQLLGRQQFQLTAAHMPVLPPALANTLRPGNAPADVAAATDMPAPVTQPLDSGEQLAVAAAAMTPAPVDTVAEADVTAAVDAPAPSAPLPLPLPVAVAPPRSADPAPAPTGSGGTNWRQWPARSGL
ncbi:hypothetical protein KQ945_16080 [Bacillus subtilis subsp. subtilis]|nr:hypothetical protein [Bacillus subtilis subsp. subtilis]